MIQTVEGRGADGSGMLRSGLEKGNLGRGYVAGCLAGGGIGCAAVDCDGDRGGGRGGRGGDGACAGGFPAFGALRASLRLSSQIILFLLLLVQTPLP